MANFRAQPNLNDIFISMALNPTREMGFYLQDQTCVSVTFYNVESISDLLQGDVVVCLKNPRNFHGAQIILNLIPVP